MAYLADFGVQLYVYQHDKSTGTVKNASSRVQTTENRVFKVSKIKPLPFHHGSHLNLFHCRIGKAEFHANLFQDIFFRSHVNHLTPRLLDLIILLQNHNTYVASCQTKKRKVFFSFVYKTNGKRHFHALLKFILSAIYFFPFPSEIGPTQRPKYLNLQQKCPIKTQRKHCGVYCF